MIEIKAIIQPRKLDKVREALGAVPGFPGMTITRAEGCGPAEDRAGHELGLREQLTDFSAKIRLEILAPDDLAETLATLIHQVAHTGQPGDGIVWLTGVQRFERIRHNLDGA